jgi:hypothetical protein
MSQKQAELLGSRLKWWNFLHLDTEICFFCFCYNQFKEFLSQENDLIFCNDVRSGVEALGHQYNPIEWHLLTDS